MENKRSDLGVRRSGARPFRTAVLRGLAVVLPPLLTVVIFLWISGTVQMYLLQPINVGLRNLLVQGIADVRQESDLPAASRGRRTVTVDGVEFQRLESGSYVRKLAYDVVAAHAGEREVPKTSQELYARYVELTYLRPYLVIPFLACLFILVLYLLGKFLAAGIGRMLLNLFEWIVGRIPLVRNVYSAVKQVSDFVLTEREFRSSRVVAIEYPRKGIWSLAMVTGDGMGNIADAAHEPVLSVFVPTSPMPMAGFTATVKKSETVDLNITMDQAIQFIVSCGVVIPHRELQRLAGADPIAESMLPQATAPSTPQGGRLHG